MASSLFILRFFHFDIMFSKNGTANKRFRTTRLLEFQYRKEYSSCRAMRASGATSGSRNSYARENKR